MFNKIYYFMHRVINGLNHIYLKSCIKGDTKSLLLKGRISILFPENITVGANCTINDGVMIHAGREIFLGDNVTISMGAKIITRQYDMTNWVEQCKNTKMEKNHIALPIYMAEHTWIGAGAIILPGVKINGKGVVVGAGTILTKDLNENFVLVAGSPAKVVKKYISKELI